MGTSDIRACPANVEQHVGIGPVVVHHLGVGCGGCRHNCLFDVGPRQRLAGGVHNLAIASPVAEPAATCFFCNKHVISLVNCHDGSTPGCDVWSGAVGADIADWLELKVLTMMTLPARMAGADTGLTYSIQRAVMSALTWTCWKR